MRRCLHFHRYDVVFGRSRHLVPMPSRHADTDKHFDTDANTDLD
jgi:hypothetical protein